MKKIFTIIFSLAVSIAATAQTAAEIEICQQAETAYRIGRFDEAVSLLKDNMSRLTSRTRSTAYHLLSLCYMEKDNSDEATRYASLLLKENPYFTPTLSDPLRFVDLIESMKRGKSATITTASQQAESIDESPVPVTLITEDMIKASGAKNLRDLLMTFVPGITPLEGEDVRFLTGANGQHLFLPIDQNLRIVDIRQFFDTGRVDAELPLAEGDSRFAELGEEFAADNLKSIEDRIRHFLDLIVCDYFHRRECGSVLAVQRSTAVGGGPSYLVLVIFHRIHVEGIVNHCSLPPVDSSHPTPAG